MYRYRHFKETIPLTIRTPFPGYPGDVQKLILARISIQLEGNEIATAVEALGKDIQFWRLVLQECRDLVNKMVALAFVKRDVLFISDLLRSHRLNKPQATKVRNMLRPLSREERDMSPAVRREFSMMVHTFRI